MPHARQIPALVALVALAACSRGGGGPAPIGSANVSTAEPVWLDTTLRVTFGVIVDPGTVSEQSVQLVAVQGPGVGVPVRGAWRLVGTGVEFVPELADGEPLLQSCGLQPGTRYELRVLGGEQPGGLRATDGRPIPGATFAFVTRGGTSIADVVQRDPTGGPRLVDVEVAPLDENGGWQLGRAFAPTAMTLRFDQPLHPVLGDAFSLVWDDPLYGASTAMTLDVELLHNTAEGAVVALHPRGVLPSHATLRLRVADTLRDLFGHDNVGAFVEPVREFATERAEQQRADALVFEFDDPAVLGATDFAEVPAVIEDGALRVPDAFPAVDEDVGDWAPLGNEVTLHTGEQTLTYQNGVTKTFTGGVLQMRNLHIPAGCVVRGVGSEPLVLVVDGDAVIEGTLSVSGLDADGPVYTGYRGAGDLSPPAPFPGEPWTAPAPFRGRGGPGGGNGGGEYRVFPCEAAAHAGGSAPGVFDGGGGGGLPACFEGFASGGGGGGAAVQGDPWFPSALAGQLGTGVATDGGANPGGAAGESWFANGDVGDDFVGRAWVPHLRREVIGELAAPRGGSGGGAGGNLGYCPLDLEGSFFAGSGGGGGGGVLVLQVRGRLTVTATGRVRADGGSGTLNREILQLNHGGGGGGGGGTLMLMAGRGIELHVKGGTFAELDYDFCLSADGGITATDFVSDPIHGKYPANGQPTFTAAEYEARARGGFGGMGLVQLMVPVGRNNADGTNTVLDDAIDVVRDGQLLLGFDKQRYLGWRGFPDDSGVLVDDFGVPTGTIGGQGDIRPDPVLLPVPFASNGTARARSRWLPLGALHRRALTESDGLPRGVVGEASTFSAAVRQDGWLHHADGDLSPLSSAVPVSSAPVLIAAAAVDTTTLAVPALRVELLGDLPFVTPGAFTGAIADGTRVGGGSWTQRRILHSDARTLWLDGTELLPEQVDRLQLRGWFVDLASNAPASYLDANGVSLPRANARIGFAFHRSPDTALAHGTDPERYPAAVGTFLYDLTSAQTRSTLRAFGPRAIQWDIVLDGEWARTAADQPPPADQDAVIALRRLFLPVRY
ncbi:MAG: hypothetical protein R3F29_08630 [Planctomycetota bacterium]